MFRWFEQRLDPFPAAEPDEPPKTLFAFCLYYTRASWPFCALSAICMALIAIMEVWMFGFLGHIVDWLAAQNRETFLQTEKAGSWSAWRSSSWSRMPAHGAVSVADQAPDAVGNYPDAHALEGAPLLLGQSMSFYQDEFAGRIATKVMQTALAVRDTVIEAARRPGLRRRLFRRRCWCWSASADWRLALPFVVWLVALRRLLLRYFVPRLGKRRARRRPMRAR